MTNKYHNPAAAQMIAIIFAVIFFNCTVKLFAYDDWEKTKSPFCWNFTCFGEDRGGRVFAGSWGDGLYQLSGSGTTWTKVSTNLQDPYITCMFIDSSNKIFVGTYGSGVCYSTDYGVHWIQTTNGLENLSIKTIIKNVAGNLLVGTNNGGIFRSTNLGVTWLPANHGLWYQDVNSLCLSINGGICAATNGGGFYYSKDDGKTWVRSNATTTGTNYRIDYAYQMLAKIDGNIYATTAHRGIVYSPDGGIQWYELDSLGMKSYNMYAITTNPALLIVAGTRTTGISYYDDKLYNMWKQSDFFTSGPDALFRTSTGTMFAAMPIEGIYSSSDGGKTWKKHSFNNATGLVALTQGKNGLAFCGRTPTGLSISTDYGKSWANAGLDTNTIFCVAIDSSNNILVGAPSGIYKSTNNGGIWTFLGLASMSPKYISVLRNGNIIASANDFNISTNAGVTWKKITIAKDALGNAFGCEFTAGNYNNDIYASAGGNLFKSTNAGTNWTNLSNDVAPLNTLSMNFDYQGNIYASCQWNGLYISTNNGTSWTGDKMGKANVYFLATAFNTQNKLVNIQRVTNGIGGTWIRKSPNNWDSLNSNMTIIDMQSLSTNSLGYTYATTDAIYSRIDSNKLIPPNLLAPASNTTGLNINPSFSWTSSSFAEAYNFEIANDPSFPYSMEYRTQSSTTVTLERPLYYATTYYWRVRAKYNNSLSEWSNVRAFTTIIPPPNLISPADGARGVKRKHDLVWNSVITATNYDYQVATDTLFSSIISTQTFIPDTTVNLTLQDYTQYFWRARAAAGTAYGPWSKYRRYLTAVAPPQLTSPADKSSGMDTVVVMTWDTSVASTKYIILISKSPDFSPDSIIYEGTTDENNRHRMPLLQFNKTYWWKIKAGNDDGYGEFCDPWSYTTGIKVPLLASPADSITNQPINLTIKWNNLINDAKQHIQVSKDPTFKTFLINDSSLSANTYDLKNLEYYTKYYWRASNVKGSIQSFWSSTWAFKTTIPTPVAVYPAKGDTTKFPLNFNISWNQVPNATLYHFQISTDPTFADIVKDTSGMSDIFIKMDSTLLKYNTTYYCHVDAKNKDSQTPYSEIFSFTTKSNINKSVRDNIPEIGSLSAYPNPFAGELRITLNLKKAARVNISIVDISGNKVEIITNNALNIGNNELIWKPEHLSQGKYFLNAEIDGTVLSRELIYLK